MCRPMNFVIFFLILLSTQFYPTQSTTVTKLLATDGIAFGYFGYSVSIDGDYAIVGSYTPVAGTAYILHRNGSTWAVQQKLVPSDGVAADHFGFSVSISGATVIVGARHSHAPATDSGAAYVFTRLGSTWTEQQKLIASDGAASDKFGEAVSISNDSIIVGAQHNDDMGSDSGSAYIFVRNGSTWTQQQKLLPSDGTSNAFFGHSVSIHVDSVIVGASGSDINGSSSGATYIFVRAGTIWSQQAQLLPSDAATLHYFGSSVSMSGDSVVVGAYGFEAAYIFIRSGVVWSQQQKLIASDGLAGDSFGYSVSISVDFVVVGAYLNDATPIDCGAAYRFVRSGVTWMQREKLIVADRATNDDFGFGVSISGDSVIVGAYEDDDLFSNSGSAYLFLIGSSSPTMSPSGGPTRTPSEVPSKTPSSDPTTGTPSAAPSTSPPTAIPSSAPSSTPFTWQPSVGPSTTPSSGPSTAPATAQPTSPSNNPTQSPSSIRDKLVTTSPLPDEKTISVQIGICCPTNMTLGLISIVFDAILESLPSGTNSSLISLVSFSSQTDGNGFLISFNLTNPTILNTANTSIIRVFVAERTPYVVTIIIFGKKTPSPSPSAPPLWSDERMWLLGGGVILCVGIVIALFVAQRVRGKRRVHEDHKQMRKLPVQEMSVQIK